MLAPSLATAIKSVSATYKVSGLILCAVALQEGSGDIYAYNEKEDAHGAFQLKLKTAQRYCPGVDLFDLYDPGRASSCAAIRLSKCRNKDHSITGQIKCLNSEGWRKAKKSRNPRLTYSEHTRRVLSQFPKCMDIE